MLYLTPALYRTMGFGADLSDIEDAELATQLGIAARLANRTCNLPTDYDFRGGSVTDEPHPWRLGNSHVPGPGRVFPDRPPLKALTSFRIRVTNTQYLDIVPERVHYHADSNSLEPVIAATSIGVWSYSAVPVAGLREPEAEISYSYGYEFAVTDEELHTEGGSVFRAQHQWWTADEVTVKKVAADGTITTLTLTTDYTVSRDEGTIKLADPPGEIDVDIAAGDVLTASYTHKLPWEVRDAVGIIATDLLASRNVVGAGLLGYRSLKAEEISISVSRELPGSTVSERARLLLAPFRRVSWG